jgi:hypothetical protein
LPFRLQLLAQRTQVHTRRPFSTMSQDMAESMCIRRGSKTAIKYGGEEIQMSELRIRIRI